MRLSKWGKAVVLVLSVLGVASLALAQGRGKGGGGQPGEEASNSLSVPAILIGGNPFGLNTSGAVVAPEDEGAAPLSGYPIDPLAYFYVQGIHRWQASAIVGLSAHVDAAWGDNLTGEARLKTNSPIRVEMGLLATDPTSYLMTGWDVEKLEPDKLDREAAYGTRAIDPDADGVFEFIPITPYDEVRVYDNSAWLTIFNKATPDNPIVDQLASAEVNSTGRIVYGYNLRVPTAGTYVIEFTAPNVNIVNANAGAIDGNTVTLEISVVTGGGGGRRGGGPPITAPGQQTK